MLNDSQLGYLYAIMALFVVLMFVLLESLRRPEPVTKQQMADRICQELYGPQTGATWVEGALKCQTARGEVLEMRKWQ
jgi:hypothetical protein